MEGHTESFCGGHFTVKEQRESQPVLVDCLLKALRLVRTNTHDLKTKFEKRLRVLAQLNQLLYAMASPVAAIEDKHTWLLCNGRIEVNRLTINTDQRQYRNLGTNQKWLNRFHIVRGDIVHLCHCFALHN